MDEVGEADEERDRGLLRGRYGRHPRGLRPLDSYGGGIRVPRGLRGMFQVVPDGLFSP